MQSIPTQVGSPYEGEGDKEESEAEATDTGLQQLHTEQNVFIKFDNIRKSIKVNKRYNLTQKVMMNLWVAMAPNMVQTSELDSSRPTASPSNTAWKERASTVKKSLKVRGFHRQGDCVKCIMVINDVGGVNGAGGVVGGVGLGGDGDHSDVAQGPNDSTLALSQII